jgi:hypothetical protein
MAVDIAAAMAKSPRRPQAETEQTSTSESTPYSSSATGGYDRDRVATRAYELYMQRGGGDGNDMEDWLRAEREFSSNGGSPGDGRSSGDVRASADGDSRESNG